MMGTQDATVGAATSASNQQYLSKRVVINGQFVTLYSTNGLTWLSSPEDLPDTMARLDNTRITLNDEKGEEGVAAGAKDKDKDKDKAKGKEKGSEKGEIDEKVVAAAPKQLNPQYRIKGPKPRPILRQGGKVVQGTPIEPVSGSSMNVKASADTSIPQVKLAPVDERLRRGKLVAPIAQRRPEKIKAAPASKPAATVKQAAEKSDKTLKKLKGPAAGVQSVKVKAKAEVKMRADTASAKAVKGRVVGQAKVTSKAGRVKSVKNTKAAHSKAGNPKAKRLAKAGKRASKGQLLAKKKIKALKSVGSKKRSR